MQKRKVLSLEWKSEGVMDDESGESMELMKEVTLKELGDAEVERLVCLSHQTLKVLLTQFHQTN